MSSTLAIFELEVTFYLCGRTSKATGAYLNYSNQCLKLYTIEAIEQKDKKNCI